MSNRIQVLPPVVAERIAAGEIIERPYSVVKELVENSLDAHATEVLVRLEGGGKELIEITDNGCGMSREDLQICIERHATSKLKSLDDLDRISTLGFRGEALPSIAAVSDMTFISKTEEEDSAHELQVGDLAGRLLQKPLVRRITFGQFIDSNHGTQIQARGLFSQVPARLKFMKSQASEVSQVRDWLERLAMAHPQVGFHLISDDRTLLKLKPENEVSRIKNLLAEGEDFPVLTAENEQNGVHDLGFRARIHWVQGLSSPNSRKLIQIVNSRAIRDRLLQQAILGPFKQTLLPGQFPAVALFIEVHPAAIDVNVHPTKSEIRFLDSRRVFQILDGMVKSLIKKQGAPAIVPDPSFASTALSPTLASSSSGTSGSLGKSGYLAAESNSWSEFRSGNIPWKDSARSKAELGTSWERQSAGLYSGGRSSPSPYFQETLSGATEASWTPPHSLPTTATPSDLPGIHSTASAHTSSLPSLLEGTRFVGVLFRTYLMYERDELILIDQHAAHERIRYEALKKRFQAPTHSAEDSSRPTSLPSQALLIPETISFSPDQRSNLEQILKQIAPWGFDGEIFGESSILFRSVPAEWGHHQLKLRLKNLIDRLLAMDPLTLTDSLTNSKDQSDWFMDENLFEALASEACHSAIRAGDPLENEEASSLVRQLFETEHPWNCPHGRPTVVRVSRGKLEEWFQRKLTSSITLDH